MNRLEKDVLGILAEDSRTTADKMAVMLGETEENVKNAVRSLEKRGVIVKYTAVSNLEEEEELVEALIEVTVTPQSVSGFDGIAEEISGHDEVKSLYLMSGTYDFLVIVEAPSIKGVSRFISECISTFNCVTGTATHFILKKYKTEGVVTRAAGKERRLSYQP